ncbi:hypothetical protein PF003_g20222 [Phytophthora fragariae]|nr:hypothetical protein PF003_g20222 [Phytophthora fragariae]
MAEAPPGQKRKRAGPELELNVEETLMTSLAELPGRQLPLNVDDKDLGMAAPITQPQALQRCVYRILATKGMTSALIKSWKTSVQGRRTLTTERSSPGLLCTYVVHVVGGEGAADVEGVRFVGRQALRAQQEVTPALLSWQTTTWRTLMVQRARQVSLCLLCAVRGGRGGRGGRTVRGAASAASPAGGDASIVVVADDDMADADGAAGQAGVAVPAVRVSGVRGGRSVRGGRGGRGGRTVRGAASAASPAGGDASIVVVADDDMADADVGAVGAADVEGVRFVGRQALRAQPEVTSALLSWQTTSWLTLKEKQTRQVWLCLVWLCVVDVVQVVEVEGRVDEVHVGFAEVGLLDAWLEQQELVHVVAMTVTRLAQLLSALLLVAAVEHQLVESPSPNL